MSFSTCAAASTRSETFVSSSAAKEKEQRETITASNKNFFMVPHHTKIFWDLLLWIVNEPRPCVSATLNYEGSNPDGIKFRVRVGFWKAKKIGAESSDPNRHSQPRLPGSVVGEASMPRAKFPCKITEVTAPKLPSKKRVARRCLTS